MYHYFDNATVQAWIFVQNITEINDIESIDMYSNVISTDAIAVGCPNGNNGLGFVFLYEFIIDGWFHMDTLGPSTTGKFGSSVALTTQHVLASSNSTIFGGDIYIFVDVIPPVYDNATFQVWNFSAILSSTLPYFGQWMDISANNVLVGADIRMGLYDIVNVTHYIFTELFVVTRGYGFIESNRMVIDELASVYYFLGNEWLYLYNLYSGPTIPPIEYETSDLCTIVGGETLKIFCSLELDPCGRCISCPDPTEVIISSILFENVMTIEFTSDPDLCIVKSVYFDMPECVQLENVIVEGCGAFLFSVGSELLNDSSCIGKNITKPVRLCIAVSF